MASPSKCNFRSLTAAVTAADNCAVPPLSVGRQACATTKMQALAPAGDFLSVLPQKGS
jgi:hypothetical protein